MAYFFEDDGPGLTVASCMLSNGGARLRRDLAISISLSS